MRRPAIKEIACFLLGILVSVGGYALWKPVGRYQVAFGGGGWTRLDTRTGELYVTSGTLHASLGTPNHPRRRDIPFVSDAPLAPPAAPKR
jgi:hypothetical protein